jgi:hypothetical protein
VSLSQAKQRSPSRRPRACSELDRRQRTSALLSFYLNDIEDPEASPIVIDAKSELSRVCLRMTPPDCGKRVWFLDLGHPAFGMSPLRPIGDRPVHITEELLAEARRLYASGRSLRQVAAELHPRTSYKTVASGAEALYGHFKRRAWKLRPQHAVTIARNYKPGRKPRGQARDREQAYRRWLAAARLDRVQGRAGRDARQSR